MEEVILKKLYESLKNGEISALAVITEEVGSSPRKSGSMMAITEKGYTIGSVGGGYVEYAIIKRAIKCMENKEDYNFEYKLNETELGMYCGGIVKGYIKVFYPKIKLFIVGAGHIGEKLNKLAKILNFHTIIVDHRSDYANKYRFSEADEILVGVASEIISQYELTKNDFVVIVTNSHESDKLALQAVLKKPHRYVGLIGSVKKIKHIMKELMGVGFLEEQLKTVYAPIGLNISTHEPEEIAFGILSEILLIKNNGTLNHYKDIKNIWNE